MKHVTISPCSSCMVIKVCMVKGRQHSVHIRCSTREMESLDLESDKSRCSNHRDELDSAVQLPKLRSVVLWTPSYIYIQDYVRQDVRPAILVRESSTQLMMYSLDICIRYSTYLPIVKSQKGSIEALNFLIVTS
jgi:hypothetical protein